MTPESARASNLAARMAGWFEAPWDSKATPIGGNRSTIVYAFIPDQWTPASDIVRATQEQFPDISREHIRLTCRLLNFRGKIEKRKIKSGTGQNGWQVEYRRSQQ